MDEKRTLVSFDWAINNVLRDKANYDVLEGFLGTPLESEANQQCESDKFNRVDLVVEDASKEIFVIEIQNSWERNSLLSAGRRGERLPLQGHDRWKKVSRIPV